MSLSQRSALPLQFRPNKFDYQSECHSSSKYSLLSKESKRLIRWALEYKGIEQFGYMIRTQPDPLINSDVLETRFLEALEKNSFLKIGGSEALPAHMGGVILTLTFV